MAGNAAPGGADGGVGQLLSGSALVFLGLLLRIGLLLLFELLAARYLGPADYGLFSLAFTVIVVLSSLPALGLQNSLRRFISFHLEKRNLSWVSGLTLFGVAWPVAVGIPIAAAAAYGAAPLSRAVFDKPELAPLVAAMAFVIPLWSLRRLSTVVFSGYRKPLRKVALEDLLEPLLRVAAVVLVAALGLSVVELGRATLIAYLVVGIASFVLVEGVRRSVTRSRPSHHAPYRDLFGFSAPLVISELAEIVLAWVNVLLLGVLSIEYEVGLFRAVQQPPMLASAILTSFAFIYMPMATEYFARDDRPSWQHTNNAIVRWTLSLAFPIGVVCLALPEAVISVVFGDAYLDGAPAMQFLAGAYLFHAACGFTGLNLIVAGHTRLQMAGALLGLGLNVLLCFLWIPLYGATGAAAAVFFSIVARNGYNLLLMRALLRIVPFDRRYVGVLASQVLAALAVVYAARSLELPDLAGVLLVGLLQLPIAIAAGIALRVYGRSDLDWIASLRDRVGNAGGR